MFKFLKRRREERKPVTEADFDVLGETEAHGVTFSKGTLVAMFIAWTQGGHITDQSLSNEVCKTEAFKAKYDPLGFDDQRCADRLIEIFEKKNLVVYTHTGSLRNFRITGRGEQVRQYYVLRLGWRGSIYDRMDRFKSA